MSGTNFSNGESWSRYAKYYNPLKIGSIDGTDTEPHDKAIVRAIVSEYTPNKHVKGRPECTIFVSRLNSKTTKETIKEVFSKFGKLKRFRLVKDIVTGLPKGYAFIEYESESSAEEAYRRAYKMNIDGNIIFVDFECERLLKGWKPRRLGGGFAGNKESGQLRFGARDRPFKKPISLQILDRENKRFKDCIKTKGKISELEEDYFRKYNHKYCNYRSRSRERKKKITERRSKSIEYETERQNP